MIYGDIFFPLMQLGIEKEIRKPIKSKYTCSELLNALMNTLPSNPINHYYYTALILKKKHKSLRIQYLSKCNKIRNQQNNRHEVVPGTEYRSLKQSLSRINNFQSFKNNSFNFFNYTILNLMFFRHLQNRPSRKITKILQYLHLKLRPRPFLVTSQAGLTAMRGAFPVTITQWCFQGKNFK